MRYYPVPPVGGPIATGQLTLRFEDITQDGRVNLECLPTAVGSVVWPKLLADFSMQRTGPSDVMPILSRLIMESRRGPVSAHKPLHGRGSYGLAHTRTADGEVERIFVNMWCALDGIVAHTHGFPVADAGTTIEVGRVFAEHVFTRPFAAPAERRVTALNNGGGVSVPPERYVWRSPAVVLAEGEAQVEWLEPALHADAHQHVFGLMHTDSNQHVNSLIYPRLFEEAALRRLAHFGHRHVLGTALEISFRKPCFAGEQIQISLQAGRAADAFVVRGAVHAVGESLDKARAYARLVLEA